MSRRPTRMDNDNAFKLGVFAVNCSGGLTMTKAPEFWDASWDNNVRVAQAADAAGLEFVLPLGRWLGHGGETNLQEASFETLTWASGLLGATRGITVFGTLHVSLLHPVFAAKQIVTADHISKGRFGLNIVAGWNEHEFAMFGKDLLEHDERYVYAQEWVEIAKRIWGEDKPFDFHGKYFDLHNVLGRPQPYGGGRPLLLSAGNSPAGRKFAAGHADCLFMVIHDVGPAQAGHRNAACARRSAGRRLCLEPPDRAADAARGRGISPLHRARDGRLGRR